ncbi:MAG: ABC transporter permease, partial [Chloroflexi bacterium]|nr:ABC transporter permease [Chloroflexota bacterium]
MLVYTSMRMAQALMTLLVASFVVFALSHASGNPVDVMLPREASMEERQAFIEVMGLDRPMIVQYGDFLVRAIHGDFGTSIRTREPASVLVFERIAPSMKLATVAIVFTLLMSIPLGVLAAVYRERWIDRTAMLIALSGQAMPAFWIGPMAVLVFSVWLGWLPTSGMGSWKHYILPSIVLGWGISAGIVRLLRSTMLEVLDSE